MDAISELAIIFFSAIAIYIFLVCKFAEFKIPNQWIKSFLGITTVCLIISGVGLLVNIFDYKKNIEQFYNAQLIESTDDSLQLEKSNFIKNQIIEE